MTAGSTSAGLGRAAGKRPGWGEGVLVDRESEKTAARGTIDLTAVPEDCEVMVDGAYVGNTPASLKLAEGMHRIEVTAKDFEPWTRTVRVLGDSTTRMRAELEKTR